ncbi:hypothetical protein OE88DRAFT_1730827 [Heliocybe sulcata]|uniref:Uncharacterized protein n=1 Tax=Heliocybe sulcata TaxID=5364 RepID=A0A5C3NJ92_9AGAM|nr:hypothetical protein OE88DRAFT_1730827 [Heliocybe sulcata]
MPSGSSPFNPFRAAPSTSSPLARSSPVPISPFQRPTPTRNVSFARSRPLRPFASVANSLPQAQPGQKGSKGAPKLIEPPKKFSGTFSLNLTQAELSRQD